MILAYTEPHMVSLPQTSNNGVQVLIKWVAPYSGGVNISITSYEI